MGADYARLKASLRDSRSIEYVVVDTPESCAQGRELFGPAGGIDFLVELPAGETKFDVVYCSTSLQYVREYREVLARLARYGASYVLLPWVPAGSIRTFASAQLNVPGSVIPYWFFNLEEVCAIMLVEGYDLVFRAAPDREFNMDNFPPSLRLRRQVSLLFARRSEGSLP